MSAKQLDGWGNPIPTERELRQINRACDDFLRRRGEHVGGFGSQIQNDYKVNLRRRKGGK